MAATRRRASTKKRPSPRKLIRLDSDARRAQLLAMGRRAFASHSYDEVSIDELARKAKISKGLFYYYFPTKRDLYIAGLRDTGGELVAKLTSVPRDLAPRPRAIAAVDAYLTHVAQQGPAFLALMRGGVGSDPKVSDVIERIRLGILDELMRGPAIGAMLRSRPLARIALRGWIGMVEATSIEWLGSGGHSREVICELLVDMLFATLARILAPADAARLGQR